MSLRDSYFNGPSGLQQQMDGAFAAGVAYVGAGTTDITTLDLNMQGGSALAAGSGNPGKYFTYCSPTALYAMWIYVSGELAPTVSNAILVQVTVLSGDNATQVAAKIATAMNAIPNEPFAVISNVDVVTMENNTAGVALFAATAGTLGGGAAVAQVQAGIAPTGNYTSLQGALLAAAAQGELSFRVNITGTGTGNAQYLRNRNGDNLYLRSFFAGILQAMAGQDIYDYQVGLELDISMHSSTNVIFHFNFGNKHDERSRPHVRLEPLKGCQGGPIFTY